LDGDIAVIAAGGGGSVVNMDALIASNGKPANYTEHSGNPPREKLQKLTKIVLAKPDLKGCWFVGGTANFTDIYETLMGFVEGLREVKPKPNYPIVIRRGGPRDKEAFAALKEIGEKEGFDFHIYGRETPMTATAKIMVELAYGKKGK
jgi:succinyl-CoA synthetase beta subunit